MQTDHRRHAIFPANRMNQIHHFFRCRRVKTGDRFVGQVLGFDACHFPNHYNVLVHTAVPVSGADLQLRPEEPVHFTPARVPAL